MTELADLAIVKLPTMTKVVQRMAAAGLVTSAPSPSDGRVTEVFLAPPGAVVRLKAWEIANHLYREAFADIDASAEHELNDLLKRVFRNLEPRA